MQPDAMQSLAELFSFGRLFASAVALALAWLGAQAAAWILRLASARFSSYRLTIGRLFPIVRLVIWGFALYFVIVVIFHPQATSVLALTASAGLAFGLAAQEIVRNILAGIFILFDEPFRVGDMVRVNEHYGEVTNIGIRSTRIHTFDDSTIAIPNSVMMNQAVSNSNSGRLQEMVVIDFTLPAFTDTAAVKAIAAEAASSSPYIYLRKPITVMVEDRFDRTFLTTFHIKCYVLDVRYERLLASDVLERLKGEITARGILTPEIVLGLMAAEPRTGAA